MTTAYINRIATLVPPHEVHGAFVDFARSLLLGKRGALSFERMVEKAQIERRFSVLEAGRRSAADAVDANDFYRRGQFPSTAQRMALYEKEAPVLALRTVAGLALGAQAALVTHVIVTSCTGFYAPGLDLDLVQGCGLNPGVERTMVGFMGCYAAVNALKLAHHIIRSTPSSVVLVLNLELCTLHLQETDDIEQVLSFLLFGDGCAASLISAEPIGLGLDRFHAVLVPETAGQITWKIRDRGFDMHLSGRVPSDIARGLKTMAPVILPEADEIALWAVHPGGRSILDAVQMGLGLPETALDVSRAVLRSYGNMSSVTIMFVLAEMLAASRPGQRGCAMAFGPGLTAETFLFHRAGS